ncbi:efflux RND transporter periplasmic adaptor subunit [bacterium]|nr:efflux RND transporter periplasmic adaptor subunit [bacterium]
MMRNLGMFLLLLLVIAGTAWVVHTYRKPGSMTVIESQAMDMSVMTAPPGTTPVSTARVRVGPFLPLQTYTGTVRAWSDEDVVARVTGQVVQTYVYPGDRVYAGQLLVQLDSAELESRQAEAQRLAETEEAKILASQASLRKSQSDSGVARRELDLARLEELDARAEEKSALANLQYWNAEMARTRYLYNSDAVSLEEFQKIRAQAEEAKTQHHHRRLGLRKSALKIDQARRQLESQRAGIEEAMAEQVVSQASAHQQRAAQTTAEVILSYTQIRARSSAIVTERLVSPGTLVMPGAVLFRLKQTDRLRLQAKVPAQLSAQLRPGLAVRYRSHSNGPLLATRLTSVFREADASSRTVTVEAVVKDPQLVPGEFVELSLATGPEKRQLSVPLQAIQRDLDNQPFVWKAVARGTSASPIYTCVMHPEIHSDRPGQCPKCGMDLTLQNPSETSAQPDYTCVMHPEISQSKPGKCPKCGMDLVAREKKGNLTVTRQPVELAQVSGTEVAIRSGLTEQDEVVVQGASNLREGMAISHE